MDDDSAHDTQADAHHNTEEPKEAEQPAPILEPRLRPLRAGAPVAAPSATFHAASPAEARRYLCDADTSAAVSAPSSGRLNRLTVGGRMTCFSLSNPAGLVAKYRLGNECEVWSETHFTLVTYVGDDGVVATVHFMPTIYIPTTYVGYSPTGTVNSPLQFTTSTGATLSLPESLRGHQGDSLAVRRDGLG